jgi:hypothetical protein
MRSRDKWLVCFGVLSLAGLGAVRIAWAGPYLFRAIEMAPASSQKECEGHVVRILGNAQKEGRLSVDKENPRLAWTPASTVHVDCIFVGQNEQRRDQWIFYIAVASTDRQDSDSLMDMLRTRFSKLVRID